MKRKFLYLPLTFIALSGLLTFISCTNKNADNENLSSQSPTPENCPLAVYLDFPQYPLRPISSTPMSIIGWVNKPDAQVTVNDKTVQVDNEGYFSSEVLLREGNNIIRAEATLNGQTDSMAWTLLVENGIVSPPPGQGLGNFSVLRHEHLVEMKRGDKITIDVTLETRKEFRGKEEIIYSIYPVANEYSEDEIPINNGMEIKIDPSSFIACPNTKYHSTITVTTTNAVSPGDYWFHLEKTGGSKTTSWFDVRVR